MICEHKRESRSAPASTPLPLPSLGTCLESSWLCAGFPLRRLWAYPGQTISGAAVDKCGVFAAALLHSRLAAAASAPALALAPALPLPSLPLFLPSATARFSIVFAAILLPAAPLTAASPCPSSPNHCLILPLSAEGSPKGTYEIGKVITLS